MVCEKSYRSGGIEPLQGLKLLTTPQSETDNALKEIHMPLRVEAGICAVSGSSPRVDSGQPPIKQKARPPYRGDRLNVKAKNGLRSC